MNINLGLVGFSWTPVHISYWTHWPKLPKLRWYYSTRDQAYFAGLTYHYNVKLWDKRTDLTDGWRHQEQDKHMPVLGIWEGHAGGGYRHWLRVFGFRFKIDVQKA